jgi:hypothetical protein
MYQDELYHHGILGQKWGVRRFQNKDGTRTAAGKKRYSGPFASIKKAKANRKRNKALKKARKTREKNRAEKQDLEAKKKEWAKNPKSLSEHFDEFSNDEITEALTRLDLQKKVANLRQDQIMRGKKYIDMIGDVSKDLINVATMFNTIDATVKALSDGDSKDSKTKTDKDKTNKDKTNKTEDTTSNSTSNNKNEERATTDGKVYEGKGPSGNTSTSKNTSKNSSKSSPKDTIIDAEFTEHYSSTAIVPYGTNTYKDLIDDMLKRAQ